MKDAGLHLGRDPQCWLISIQSTMSKPIYNFWNLYLQKFSHDKFCNFRLKIYRQILRNFKFQEWNFIGSLAVRGKFRIFGMYLSTHVQSYLNGLIKYSWHLLINAPLAF